MSRAGHVAEPTAPKMVPTATAPTALVGAALRSRGAPLDPSARTRFERRFGHDFAHIRVHTDAPAAASATALGAEAYAYGAHLVFAAGRYAPGAAAGERLLAHELAHTLQHDGGSHPGPLQVSEVGDPAEQEARSLAKAALSDAPPRGGVRARARRSKATARVLMRQASTAARAPAAPPATVEETAQFLEDMASFLQSARLFVDAVVASVPGQPVTEARLRRAHGALNQKALRDAVRNARTAYDLHAAAIAGGSPAGTRLRTAMLALLAKVREVAPAGLAISDRLGAATRDAERRTNAELMGDLIDADPFTSAGLLGTPVFGAAELAAGRSHEDFIAAYLDDLIRTLPGQTLPAADRDRLLARIAAGLRRAFVTVAAGPSGAVDVRAITNPTIVDKYRRVTALLAAGMTTRPAQLSVITDTPPAFTLPPDPVPDVTAQLRANPNIGSVDLSHVPPTELAYVRHGVLNAANTVFPPTSTIQLRDASWPMALPVRRGGAVVRVRYDLIFDATGNVRVERLGDAVSREVAPAFAQLTPAQKKAQLVVDFGLAAVDDRPAAPGRPAATWTGPELDQVKAAYDLLPAADHAALRGVTLVRDHSGPAAAAGSVLAGFAHTGPSAAHDQPAPPPHAPPHIHYYDAAFAANDLTAVGAAGATGPGGDFTLLHEVGHMRMFLATRTANAAVQAANAQLTAVHLAPLTGPLPAATHAIRSAYVTAAQTANAAIVAFNAALVATPPAGPGAQAPLLLAAQTAVTARNTARAALAAAPVPPAMVSTAVAWDAANDALLAASLSIAAAADQIPTFVALAGRFGFTPFTAYAASGGPDEFFAESYALFLTDPDRLNQLNRPIFQWFAAGMPMDRSFAPPP